MNHRFSSTVFAVRLLGMVGLAASVVHAQYAPGVPTADPDASAQTPSPAPPTSEAVAPLPDRVPPAATRSPDTEATPGAAAHPSVSSATPAATASVGDADTPLPATEPALPPPTATSPAGEPTAASALEAPTVQQPSVEEPTPTAGYDKGFFLQSPTDPFALKINVMMQPRFTWEGVDEAPDEVQLAMKRVRLKLTGNAFSKDLTYFFQTEFGSGSVKLMDAFLDYGIVPQVLHVRLGQFRRPFSRQFVSAVTKMELVDRAITGKAFGDNRDIGFVLHDKYDKSPRFEYAVGAFNGNGYGSHLSGHVLVDPDTGEGDITSGSFNNVPDHFHPLLIARVGYNHNGLNGYSEADLEGGAPRFGIGVAGLLDFDADGGDDSSARATADAMVKAYGFSATAAGYVSSTQSGGAFEDQSFEASGFMLQAGYVILERVQPVVRWAVVFPDGDDNDLEEILGGLSVYFKKHSLKWQTDAGIVAEETADDPDVTPVVQSQLQAVF